MAKSRTVNVYTVANCYIGRGRVNHISVLNVMVAKYKYTLLVELNNCSPSLSIILSDRPLDFHQDIIPYWEWHLAQNGEAMDWDKDGLTLMDESPETLEFVERPPEGYDFGPEMSDDLVED